ncbi:MAG: AraC family transcriptional regulator [Microcystis aeruginosa LG13-03]|jgi:AraC-like DNA-binding protein|uniref:AraC family transcriptional regulator n=1 Tax=Microcystis sp. TaxID=1127 RepID=UPI00391AD96E|nr:AraC family transcriptional regulator [Microcystis aeruginosa LG13-13]NCR03085.1 AraC family transcriptional regulator [Microcystis aeruginosa LG13-03]NCR61123.1 AraC family transcriptional regulator [Microcystis aeruginosa LG11-05]
MKYIPLLRVNTLLPFVTFLHRIGSPTEKLLEEVKLPLFALDHPESLIPRHQAFSLIEKAAHREGIDNLGLLVGKATSIADLGTFGRIICQSLTVYDAFNTVKNMINANNSGEIFWIKEQEKTAYFCQRYLHNQEVNCHYAAQFASRLMIELVSIALGKLWQPPTIYLQGERGCDLKDESLSRTKILAGMGFTAIVFPRSFLSLPLKFPVALDNKPSQKDRENLYSSSPIQNISGSLKQVITPLLPNGYPDINLAKEITGMSVRTLQRRLGEEGLTYTQVVEKIRFEQAVLWLQEPQIKLIDIAMELGYSDPAHFTRAFKRWTGLSPRDFRCQKLANYQ